MKRVSKILENGMKVILVQKPGFVENFAMLGIPAGGNERIEGTEPARSGVAHFLEHQMFYIDGRDVTEKLSDLGAASNAYTAEDRTCYYIWSAEDPKEAIKTLLDFVQQLDITEQTIEKEKGIILSEYAMYEQQPESRLYQEAMTSLFKGHPASVDILGTRSDIEKMSDQDLSDFYSTFYDPGRLCLCIVSAMDPDHLMELVESHEKNYPSRKKASKRQRKPFDFSTPVRKRFEDEMVLSMPYALFGIRLAPERSLIRAYELDLLVNLWLEAWFSPINPEYDHWLSKGWITQGLDFSAEINEEYSYILISSPTKDPERFFELCAGIFDQKPLPDEQIFLALKNSEIAKTLRSQDQFEVLASDLIETAFDDLDYDQIIRQPEQLSLDRLEEWLAASDFSERIEVLLKPKKAIPE